MLITRAPFDEELAQVPEEATRSDFLLKRLDELLDDDDLLEHYILATFRVHESNRKWSVDRDVDRHLT